MLEMYAPMVNSPITELATAIDDNQTTIEVVDGSKLPDAPNLAMIGLGENTETILYTQKDGNVLSGVTRGFQGVAKAWPQGTRVARFFAAYDQMAIQENIKTLDQSLAAHLNESAQDDAHPGLAELWGARIVEMDSNANGTYVRWENGLQICYGAVSITTTDDLYYRQTIVWTYPASFLQKPNVVIQPREIVGGGDAEMRYSLQNAYNWTNEISATYWLYDSERQFTSGQNLGPFQTMAIGRWK